eukprot:GHVS01067059.1.p1 GENE.GHVS01067059.1~~GHVS01067059.1.p1  ORF type:complete len:250 (+),score=36.61 GHVS01067059.1:92-841(+)
MGESTEEAAGGRMAESKPTEEKNRRSRRGTPRWPLFAIMGLTGLGCLLSVWGHPIPLGENDGSVYVVSALGVDIGFDKKKRPTITCKDKSMTYSFNFVDSGDTTDWLTDAKQEDLKTTKKMGGADGDEAVHPRVIVVTDEDKTVGSVMESAVKHLDKKLVFGSFSVSPEGNRFARATGWTKDFGKMFKDQQGKNDKEIDEEAWCKYLGTKTQDYAPLSCEIFNGEGVAKRTSSYVAYHRVTILEKYGWC